LAGETELLGENLPQCRFFHHKRHMLPGRKPGPPRWEASYGTANIGVSLTVDFKQIFLFT
jgi:hypothetical protein